MTAALAKKLRLVAGTNGLVLNSPDGFIDALEVPQDATLHSSGEGKFEYLLLFVKDIAELETLRQQAVDSIEYDKTFWIAYPKKTGKIKSDLTRDVLWKQMEPTGLRPVTQVSIDETWSAMRFRPTAEVK